MLPNCIGTYEDGNLSCDGESEASTACEIRELCQRFREWCAGSRCEPGQFLSSSIQHIRAIVDGVAPARSFNPSTEVGKQASKALEHAFSLVEHFEVSIRDRFGAARFQGILGKPTRPVAFRPGKFFTIKHTGRVSFGVSWHCVGKNDENISLVRLYPRSIGKGVLNIALPPEPNVLALAIDKRMFERLNVSLMETPKYRSICAGLDAELVGEVASMLKRLTDRGIVEIPKAARYA